MAYAISTAKKCTEEGCRKPATYAVFNGRNARIRECCQKHAEDLVKRLSEDEQEQHG